MPRFFFNLRNGSGNLLDREGVDLPDVEAARKYARGVARELMFRSEARKRSWSVMVRDQNDNDLFALPFVEVDDTLRHLNPESRELIKQASAKRLALAEAIFHSRMNVLGVRASIARIRSRPYVATENGRSVLPNVRRTI
jgi:hypothetical protein